MNRIWIAGFTGAGKTFFSNLLGRKLDIPVIHCDDFVTKDNWKEMPHIIIEQIKDKSDFILDGCACSRVLRKLNELGLDIKPTEYYYLTNCFTELNTKQISYNKGINTIQLECNKILENWGVEIIYELPEIFEQKDLDSLGWGG